MKKAAKDWKYKAKVHGKSIIKLSIAIYRKGQDRFFSLQKQQRILVMLGAVLLIGVLGLLASMQEDENIAIRAEDYPPAPERNINVSCTDSEIAPSEVSIQGGSFVKFFFKNKGTKNTSFSVRGEKSGKQGSTIAIAPETIGQFSWRVPPKIKDKTLEMVCLQGDRKIIGKINFQEGSIK